MDWKTIRASVSLISKQPSESVARRIALFLFVCSSYLSLQHLDSAYFWDDESTVAIVAKNFLLTGQRTGWDGRNLLSYRNGSLLRPDLSVDLAPGDCYACALSFWLFGASTWSGRIIFTLSGLAGIALFGRLLGLLYDGDHRFRLLSFGLLCFSCVLLLYIRQCRHYGLCVLFSIGCVCAYFGFLHTKAKAYLGAGIVSAVFLYYSNYMTCAAYLAGLAALHLLFFRRAFTGKQQLWLMVALICFVGFTLPYALHCRLWDIPRQGGFLEKSEIVRKLTLIWWNIRDLNLIGVVPWPFAIILAFIIIRYRKTDHIAKTACYLLVFSLTYIVVISLISYQPTSETVIANVRYLVALIPILVILTATVIHYVARWSVSVASILCALLLCTNVLTFTPHRRSFRWLLPAYIAEVHSDYPTGYREAVKWLKEHTGRDETVLCWPDYANYPMMFYIGDRMRFCCGLNAHTRLARDILERLDAPLFVEENSPDWFVAFGMHEPALGLMQYLSRPKQTGPVETQCRYRLVDILRVYWGQTQRPELPWHDFGPRKAFDLQTEAVYVFRCERMVRPKDAAADE